MKRWLFTFALILIVLGTGFTMVNTPLEIFIDDKKVENTEGYVVKDNKLYISEDSLKRDFGFNIFYEKNENKYRIYDMKKIGYKARCTLFEEFAKIYNPETPDEIALLWAEGVKKRNGVFQYLSLSKPLKNDFNELALKSKREGWVTGFSSPWVQDYTIIKEKINSSKWRYKIVFKAVTSLPEVYMWNATITIGKEDDKWRIINIDKNFDLM